MNCLTYLRKPSRVIGLQLGAVCLLATTACGGLLPSIPGFSEPTPTVTPTPIPTATPTPEPAAAQAAGAAASVVATPQVTIPSGFTAVQDTRLAYSFAVPGGWNELDLQGTQFRSAAGMFGLGEQLDQLDQFLASPAGQLIGKFYITDLMSAMFGGFPTILNVSVVDAPGYTAESARDLVQNVIQNNLGALGSVQVGSIDATTVNNLPAVRTTATANMSAVGLDQTLFAKVVGLVANDRIYVMTLVSPADQQGAKEPIFDQIIGSFRPE